MLPSAISIKSTSNDIIIIFSLDRNQSFLRKTPAEFSWLIRSELKTVQSSLRMLQGVQVKSFLRSGGGGGGDGGARVRARRV